MEKVRGVWITNVDSDVLDSKSNITEAVKLLADTGFNYIFPVVWNKGFTLYRSATMQKLFGFEIDPNPNYAGRDPLAEVVEVAHALGMKVIPWFEFGFASSYKQNGGHIIASNPHWAAKDQTGNLLKKNGFEWMNAFLPEVQNFILDLFLEIVKGYDVDGVQGDDRLPALPSEGGYDNETKKLYRTQFGENPPLTTKDKDWLQWRADLLTDFLARLHKSIKAVNSNLIISMAPSPYPFGFDEYLQDIPAWIKQSLIDMLHPQFYRYELEKYQELVDAWVSRFPDYTSSVSPGILARFGDYTIDPDMLWNCIKYNRHNGMRGEVLFFYEGLRANRHAGAKHLQNKEYEKYVILRRGHIGADVEAIQMQLKAKGFSPNQINGEFETSTETAVKEFQEEQKLSSIDGIVGPETLRALFG